MLISIAAEIERMLIMFSEIMELVLDIVYEMAAEFPETAALTLDKLSERIVLMLVILVRIAEEIPEKAELMLFMFIEIVAEFLVMLIMFSLSIELVLAIFNEIAA